MRVTETIKRDQVLGNIQRNAQKLQDLQLEMATGQRINKPSDDPLGATMAQDRLATEESNMFLKLVIYTDAGFPHQAAAGLGARAGDRVGRGLRRGRRAAPLSGCIAAHRGERA